MRTELTSQYSYMYSHASGHNHRETSLSWNTLFVKVRVCINVYHSFDTKRDKLQMYNWINS